MTKANRKLPEGWRWASLGDVCVQGTGIKNVELEPNVAFTYIDIGSISNETKRIIEPKVILGQNAPSRARKIVYANDVIISTTRPNLNAVALVPPNLNNQICSTGFCVLRAKNSLLNSNYLFFWVQDKRFVNNLSNLVKGALYPAVTDNQVFAQSIPLPPLDKQEWIVGVLTEKLTTVERARVAAQAQLEAAEALPAAYLRAVFESEEAKGWPRKSLGEVCEFIGGSQPPKHTFKYKPQPGYVRLVQIQDFRIDDVAVYIPEPLANRFFEEDDVMIGRYGPPVFQILRGLAGAYNVALMKAMPKEGLSKAFLYYLLQESTLQNAVIEQSQRSAGQSGVNRHFLESFVMSIPPLEKQIQLAAYLNEKLAITQQLVTSLRNQLDSINRLPAMLLRQAFNGEL